MRLQFKSSEAHEQRMAEQVRLREPTTTDQDLLPTELMGIFGHSVTARFLPQESRGSTMRDSVDSPAADHADHGRHLRLTAATSQQGTHPLLGEPYCFGMRPEPVVDPRALREARLAAGLTQHQLARLIGVAGGERISRWELGTSAPRPRMLQRLVDALGVGADSLLTPTDDFPDLRRLRATTGLSARELAERAYMAQPTLVRWESGRFTNIPSTASLEPLAAALGLSVDDVRQGLAHAKCKRDASDS